MHNAICSHANICKEAEWNADAEWEQKLFDAGRMRVIDTVASL